MQQPVKEEGYDAFIAKMNRPRKLPDDESSVSEHNMTMQVEEADPASMITRLQDMGLLKGRDHKSLKPREPADTQDREQRKSIATKKQETVPLGPVAVPTRRENQNEYTLTNTLTKRRGEFPPLRDDIEDRSLNTAEAYPRIDAFPMEEILTRGFMHFYAHNITDVMCTVSTELQDEALIINNKNALLAASTKPTGATQKKRKTREGDVSTVAVEEEEEEEESTPKGTPYTDAMIVKPTSQFSWDIPNYGANSASGKAELYERIRLYYNDCMDRMNQFFINDQLEPVPLDISTRHRPPRSFAGFRELEKNFKERFDQRLAIMKDSASRIPKFDDEPPIPKHWIDSYRLRPTSTGDLCSRGAHCRFNTYGKKDSQRYIGRVFETPREVHDRNCGTPYLRNKDRLCIDCLLDMWTTETYESVAGESVPLHQRNYFTVLCEPGQYSESCMIPTMMNDRPTGITGFVPAYSKNKRISIPIKIHQIEGHEVCTISTNYIAEMGMDFP